VFREDPDRLNGCKACSPGNLVEETVDHILQCSHKSSRDAMRDRFEGMTMTFRSWNLNFRHQRPSVWCYGVDRRQFAPSPCDVAFTRFCSGAVSSKGVCRTDIPGVESSIVSRILVYFLAYSSGICMLQQHSSPRVYR
jgi:hypothetical protein